MRIKEAEMLYINIGFLRAILDEYERANKNCISIWEIYEEGLKDRNYRTGDYKPPRLCSTEK